MPERPLSDAQIANLRKIADGIKPHHGSAAVLVERGLATVRSHLTATRGRAWHYTYRITSKGRAALAAASAQRTEGGEG